MAHAPPTPPFRLPADASERDLVAKLFRGLGDPIRLAVLELLEEHGELTVGALVDAIGEPQPKVSNHLAALRWCGFVETSRSGRNVRYRIADPRVPALVLAVRRLLRDQEHGADLPPLPPLGGEPDPLAPHAEEAPDLLDEPVAAPDEVSAPDAPATAGPAEPGPRGAAEPLLLAFAVGDGEYAVPVEDVREVVRRVATRTLPGLPPDALGVANHRGAVLQVRDLARRIGLAGSTGEGPLLVIDGLRGPVAWRVDRVTGLVQPVPGGISPPPVGGGEVTGIAMAGERVILLLAPHVLRG